MKGFHVGDDRAVIAGRQGGIVRGKQLFAQQLEKWRTRFPEVSEDAARMIYRSGYVAGHGSQRQTQRRARADDATTEQSGRDRRER